MKLLALVFGLLLALSAQAQDYFPDIPKNHHYYRAAAYLKAEGLLIRSELTRDTLFTPKTFTPAEFTQVVSESIQALPKTLDTLIEARERGLGTGELDHPAEDYRGEIEVFAQKAPDCFALLLGKFLPQDGALKAILKSCDAKFAKIVELDRQIVEKSGLTFQFPDVPKDHWAADAIQALRDQKILVGYPDGKFRGNS